MEIIPTLLPVVAAVLSDGQGRVLIQQRPEGTSMAGLWEFPGGKIEPGETPESALVRELQEELGIVVSVGDLEPFTFASEALGTRHLILLLYRCLGWKGTPEPLHAHAIRWAASDDLQTLPMPPADVPLVAALNRWLAQTHPGE